MKGFAQWQRKHEKEVAEIKNATNERIKARNAQLDIAFVLIQGYELMRTDELLADATAEFRRGFFAAYQLQTEIAQAIDKA